MRSPTLYRLAMSLVFAALLPTAAAQPVAADMVAAYLRQAARSACTAGETIDLDLPLSAETEITYDAARGTLRVFYPTQFNDLTEGWNWHPEEAAAGRDYYTYKYLPLGSTHEARGSYRTTDPAGQTIDYPIRWRWDYFFAFDNPDDFYPHDAGEAAGFVVEFPVPPDAVERLRQGDLRLSLRGRLRADCLSESTTFWKATVSAPVDFTLKKRYFVGQLVEIRCYDAASGKTLGGLKAMAHRQTSKSAH